MYNSIAELLQNILDRYPDNTSREITENDVRFVTSNLSNFFYDRITDFYKTVHTTDANYTVQSEVVEGQNNLTDSVIICDMISANRQLNFPNGIRKGNHILIFVRSMNDHSWITNISMEDISGTTNQLKHGANLIFWDGSPSVPYIMFLGSNDVGTGVVLVKNNDPIESIEITNEYLNNLYPISFQYPLNTLIRFTNLTDLELNIGQSQRIDGDTWYTSLTYYKNQ